MYGELTLYKDGQTTLWKHFITENTFEKKVIVNDETAEFTESECKTIELLLKKNNRKLSDFDYGCLEIRGNEFMIFRWSRETDQGFIFMKVE